MKLLPSLFAVVGALLAGSSVVCVVPRAFAQGGPPMITDDPGTPGDGHWEINVALTTERRAGGRESELPLVDINYGVGERLQLKYEAAWLAVREEGERTRSGLSNSVAGVKWRFFDAGEHGWSASIYPQVEFINPGSHSTDRGLAEDGTAVILPVEVMKDFGFVAFNVDAGFVSHRDGDEWFAGVALGRDLGHGFDIAAELHVDSDAHVHQTRLALNVGARLEISETCSLLGSIGRDLHDRREARATLFAYLGLQTRL